MKSESAGRMWWTAHVCVEKGDCRSGSRILEGSRGEHEPMGAWELCPSGVQGQSPSSQGQGARPLKLKSFSLGTTTGGKFAQFLRILGK